MTVHYEPVRNPVRERPAPEPGARRRRELHAVGTLRRGSGIVGRAVERAHIGELLRQAQAGSGGALVVRGEPGIGKSALVSDVAKRSHGCTVVTLRGVESEVELACSGLGELIRAFPHAVDHLPRQQAAVLRAVAGQVGQPPVTSSYAICIAVHSLITLVAEDTPLLLVVDDAHWLDPTSRDTLLFVGRRLADHPVLLLMTVRTHEDAAAALAPLPELELERLSTAESRVLLTTFAADVGIAPRVAAELAAAADGNPLAARELVAALSTAQLRGQSQLPPPDAGARALLRLISSRITRLDPATRQALLVAAVCVDPDLSAVGRAIRAAGADPWLLDHAEAAGIVDLADGRVEFTHPLLRAAIVDATSPPVKTAAYAALAATADPQLGILYRAAAADAPDETIAAGLEHAAGRAQRAGGHLTAARTLRRAAELSPATEHRTRRLLDASGAAGLAGRLDLTRTWAGEAYATSDDAGLRADARAAYAHAAMWSGRLDEARAVFADTAPHVEGSDPVRAATLLLEWALLEVMGARPRDAAQVVARAQSQLSVADMRRYRLPWPVVPHVMILNGDVAAGVELIDRGRIDLSPHHDLAWLPALCHAAQSLTWAERFEQSGVLIDQIIDTARDSSVPAALPNALAHRSELGEWTGSWTLAAADAAESIRLGRELGQLGAESFAMVKYAWILANRGDHTAMSTAASAVELGLTGGIDCIPFYADAARGRYALGKLDHRGAATWLDKVAVAVDEVSLGSPLTVPWHGDHIEALIHTNRRDEALRRLADLDRRAAGTGLAWPAAVAARCHGILATGDTADHHFARALQHHNRVEIPFEEARTRLAWANHLLRRRRRQPTRARGLLTDALSTFERLRATSWIDQARSALTLAGAPAAETSTAAPGLDDLTAQELQVALSVVKGHSNPEVAAALFLSRKSVERHLSTIYRKLDVRSRTELVAYVAKRAQRRA